MNISELGFNFNKSEKINNNDLSIGRIITVNKESYVLHDGKKEYFGKLTGNMLYTSDSPEDFPTVGDFVLFQNFDDEEMAMIHKVLGRQNLIKRKTPGKKIEYQLIGANIDYAIIMQALDNDFNLNRLERYLTMVKEFDVKPIIFFSKSDLKEAKEINDIINLTRRRVDENRIISFSNINATNLEEIKDIFEPKKTYCLIGSSGVGKTTLINNLLGKNLYSTNVVRKGDNKGKHTTTARNLIVLENGSMIIDSPGMRELANISVNDGIEQTFDEILELSKDCKFSDCTHTVEKGCKILEELENGSLDKERYDNYIKLKKESEYYERSYLEKRKRDKEFGKMVKSVMKGKIVKGK